MLVDECTFKCIKTMFILFSNLTFFQTNMKNCFPQFLLTDNGATGKLGTTAAFLVGWGQPLGHVSVITQHREMEDVPATATRRKARNVRNRVVQVRKLLPLLHLFQF